MKKIIPILLFFISLNVYSRNYNRFVTFTFQTGVNKSRFINYDGSTGRIGSINNVNLRIGRKHFIQVVGELSIYLSKAPQLINNTPVSNSFNFGYFTFPFLYGYRLGFNDSKSYAARFYFGPETGLLLWVKDKQNILNKDNVRKLLFNAIAGVGLDFKRLTVDFSFHQAMTNAFQLKTKWQVISLSTGWKF
jgi:hypothetical protein